MNFCVETWEKEFDECKHRWLFEKPLRLFVLNLVQVVTYHKVVLIAPLKPACKNKVFVQILYDLGLGLG
mgnify:CR=1 FL=1